MATASPPSPIAFGSTAWRLAFFGNKGFNGPGTCTLSIGSRPMQDFGPFRIVDRTTSGGSRWAWRKPGW